MGSAELRSGVCPGGAGSRPSCVAGVGALSQVATRLLACFWVLVLTVGFALASRPAVAEDAVSAVRLVDVSAVAEAAVFAVEGELVLVRKGEALAGTGFRLFDVAGDGVLLSVDSEAGNAAPPPSGIEGERLLSVKRGGTLGERAAALLQAGSEAPPTQIEVSELGVAPGGDHE